MPTLSLSFSLGPLTITPLFWGMALAFFFSSFSIWRKLREDYPEEVIFGLTLLMAAASFLSARLFFVVFNWTEFGFSLANWISLSLKENFSLPGAFIGPVLVAYWRIFRLNRNPWEFLDSLTLPLFYFLFFGGAGAFLTLGSYWDLGISGIGLAGFLAFPFLKRSYRSFTWYKSGKTGFLISFFGLLVFSLFLLLAFLKNGRIYLGELIWGGFLIVALGALYYRSERDIKKDFKGLFRNRFQKR